MTKKKLTAAQGNGVPWYESSLSDALISSSESFFGLLLSLFDEKDRKVVVAVVDVVVNAVVAVVLVLILAPAL